MSSFLEFLKNLVQEIKRMKTKTSGQLLVYFLKSIIVFLVVIASQIFLFLHNCKKEIVIAIVSSIAATVICAWLM